MVEYTVTYFSHGTWNHENTMKLDDETTSEMAERFLSSIGEYDAYERGEWSTERDDLWS